MQKRGQIGNVFMYILVIVVAGVIIYFGFTGITNFIKSAKQGEMISFVNSLENSLKDNIASPAKREGSVEEETFFLPDDINSVCFVDETKGFNKLVSPRVNEDADIYQGNNIYIYMGNEVIPKNMEYLELSENNNPLCLKVIDGRLRLKLTSRKSKTELDTLELNKKEIGCTLAKGESDPDNKVDIVFLGYEYEDIEEFGSDVEGYIDDVFLTTEPFMSKQDMFTFYRIDDFEDVQCTIGSWIDCDDIKVRMLASNCPNDYIIVLAERSKIKDLFNPIRSSAIGEIQSVNTADNQNVVLHEFGHSFGGLADEYVDDDYYEEVGFTEGPYPNCDSSGCDKWKDITLGCHKGCSLGIYFRPTESSIMKNLNDKSFEVVNEKVMKEKLELYRK